MYIKARNRTENCGIQVGGLSIGGRFMLRIPLIMGLWLLGGLTLLAGTVVAAPLAGKRPNIILLMTDDQGKGDLSCLGNPDLKTQHLDRLHSLSTRFVDFHVSPTCAPRRAALLGGRHEFRSGVTHTINERER